MKTLRYRIAVVAFALAGIEFYNHDAAPDSQIPEDFTGTTELVCTGERFKISDEKTKDLETIQQVDPVTLKLDFQSGRLAAWQVAPTHLPPSETPATKGDLATNFQLICSRGGTACIPTPNEKGDIQLYMFKYKADDLALGGVGTLSRDLRHFGSYSDMNGQAHANIMTCKIS